MNVATAPSMQSLGIANWAVSWMSSRLPGEEFTAAGGVERHCVKAHLSHVPPRRRLARIENRRPVRLFGAVETTFQWLDGTPAEP